MDRLDRIYTLHRLLKSARYPLSRERLADELQCSESTVYRVSDALRDRLGAPVEREEGTGRLSYPRDEAESFELPGLWFNPSELHALLTAEKLLANIQPGILQEELEPMRNRLREIMHHRHLGGGELARRVRILGMAQRPTDSTVFRTVAGALTQRRRLMLDYNPRSHSAVGRRQVSPQRLTRYRDNWYLDAWCHRRDALRSFSLDRIQQAAPLRESALEIDDAELNRELATAYGIFAGNPEHTAILRFEPERARWIADETWHPQQRGHWLDDGRFELRIPYGNPTELVLDVLRYGDEVEVVEPDALREMVAEKLERAATRYGEGG